MNNDVDPEPRKVDTLADLLKIIDLTDVTVYEHTAKRLSNDVETGAEPDPELEAFARRSDDRFEARFKLTYKGAGHILVTDVGLEYEGFEDYTVAPEVIPALLSEVAVMAAYPYLREGIATSAVRIGAPPPVLGILRRGDVQFEQPEGSDDASVESTQ